MIELWQDEPNNTWYAGADLARLEITKAFQVLGAAARPACPLLLDALRNEKLAVPITFFAAFALGHFPAEAERVVPALVALTEVNEPSEERSLRVLGVLLGLERLASRGTRVIPHVRQLLDDDDRDIARAAQLLMDKIAPTGQ